MPRTKRKVILHVPHHITHRGNNRQDIFKDPYDYKSYLSLIRKYSKKHDLFLLAYCLMKNHVHLIVIPDNQESMAKTIHTAHMRFAQHFNRRYDHCGHVWNGRFRSEPLSDSHLVAALIYTELNPVRAGIVKNAWDYPWSSAMSHIAGQDAYNLLDTEWWKERFTPWSWREMLKQSVSISREGSIESYQRENKSSDFPFWQSSLEAFIDPSSNRF